MDRINENAVAVAKFLESHGKVDRVFFPGLQSHPQYEIGLRQSTGFGGIISFELKGGVEAGARLMNSVKLWILAESLGGCDSLITHPASMTHASVPPEIRHSLGISDGFVRLSVGIEDVRDLIDDLGQGLSAA
jgi:cystathionine beta-lyase/cystathionine gamma-synthase